MLPYSTQPALPVTNPNRLRLPPTVVALMRTRRSTPSGYAQTRVGGEPTSRPGLNVNEMVFSWSATGPTGGAYSWPVNDDDQADGYRESAGPVRLVRVRGPSSERTPRSRSWRASSR